MLREIADLTGDELARLDPAEVDELAAIVERERYERARRKLWDYYPESGPLRRELYPKHMEFFRAGAVHNERALIGGNRVGKSAGAGGYEMTLHLTGRYMDWWPGRRFDRPITGWACGEDAKAVRDTIQKIMLGAPNARGTGLIPAVDLGRVTPRSNVSDAVDTAYIKHASGGWSVLTFKSYDQGRESYQGATVDVVWFDEEPPLAIYTEGHTRTMATVPGERSGIVVCTFTPLLGMSETVLAYLPGGIMPATEEDRRRAWGW
jgi:phage terminase large subunit-like protein